MSVKILSVSEITNQIKQTLEEEFSDLSIIGEISNFKAHISGHWYFTLKDSGAQISCTMWKGLNSYVFFTPQDGMKVILSGKITVYPPRGNYQIDVRSMKPAGVGELQEAFEKLKLKLSKEGLFDNDRKRVIPKFPKRIGIATAIDGAAFQDMKSIASRRFPLVELVIAPCKVQGEGSALDIVNSINRLNELKDIDVIIVGRGGGSLEDLWSFNEEIVARAIYNSKIPVISAVGHEIDFTISDFVADLRAATPSAAMELATPNIDELFAFIDEFSYYFTQNISQIIVENKDEISRIVSSYGFRLPQDLIKNKAQLLDNILYRFQNNLDGNFKLIKNNLNLLSSKLNSFDVDHILKRGFVIAKQENNLIPRANKINKSKPVTLKFYDGEVSLKNEQKERTII